MKVIFVLFVIGFFCVIVIFHYKYRNIKFRYFKEEIGKKPIYENLNCGIETKLLGSSNQYNRFSIYNEFIVIANYEIIYYENIKDLIHNKGVISDVLKINYYKGDNVNTIKVILFKDEGDVPYKIISDLIDKIG